MGKRCRLDRSFHRCFCFAKTLLFAKTLRASMTLLRRNDVRKFDAEAILLREFQCKKIDILMFK